MSAIAPKGSKLSVKAIACAFGAHEWQYSDKFSADVYLSRCCKECLAKQVLDYPVLMMRGKTRWKKV